jgi:hypothetical protein
MANPAESTLNQSASLTLLSPTRSRSLIPRVVRLGRRAPKVRFELGNSFAHDGFGESQTFGGRIEAAALNDLYESSQIA